MLYEFTFRATEGLTDAYEWHGSEDAHGRPHLEEHIGPDLLLMTKAHMFKVLGGKVTADDDGMALELDLADDAAAVAMADAINSLCLDPWRVDWVARDGNDEVYIR